MSISLQKRRLPYQPDAAINYFAPISNQSWAMLLHSGAANHPHNRFDILVAEPRITLFTGKQRYQRLSRTFFTPGK